MNSNLDKSEEAETMIQKCFALEVQSTFMIQSIHASIFSFFPTNIYWMSFSTRFQQDAKDKIGRQSQNWAF